jgi:hypothetical protein
LTGDGCFCEGRGAELDETGTGWEGIGDLRSTSASVVSSSLIVRSSAGIEKSSSLSMCASRLSREGFGLLGVLEGEERTSLFADSGTGCETCSLSCFETFFGSSFCFFFVSLAFGDDFRFFVLTKGASSSLCSSLLLLLFSADAFWLMRPSVFFSLFTISINRSYV